MGALSTHGALSGRDDSYGHFWLEEKHRKTPSVKVAMAIALHYLILALRDDAGMASEMAQEYCARAARWQAMACETTVAALAAKATEEN